MLALWLLPGAAIVALDLVLRAAVFARWPLEAKIAYGETAIVSIAMWGALLCAASARAGTGRFVARALLLVAAGFAIGAQLYFFERYSAFLNQQAILVGTSMLPSVGQQLWHDRAAFARCILPPVAMAALVPLAIARFVPVSPARARVARDVAAVAFAAAFVVGLPERADASGATPDILYLSGLGRLAHAAAVHEEALEALRPGPRTPLPVAPLAPARRRSVILIVDESLRASDVCTPGESHCATTPFTAAAAPGRVALTQMRSLGSTTAESIAVLWSGLPATASRADFHRQPLVWEYAKAAGYATAYFSAQNPFFANAGLWLAGVPFDAEVTATAIDPDASYELGADDGKLVDIAIERLRALPTPVLAVVHLSNTHFPYWSDPGNAPFQPTSDAMGDDAERVHNRYRNAVYRQDAFVAKLLTAVRASPAHKDAIVIFVSDHGEQIKERGAIGHTFGVYDEELRVAAFVDAPPSALDEAEARALRSYAAAPITHLDVLPTVLDAMGVLDSPAIAEYRAKMPGNSLFRARAASPRPTVLTNCSTLFACAFKNWGAIAGTRKIVGDEKDRAWHCFDVAADPGETHDLGEAACADLRVIAEGDGRGAPWGH